MSHHNYHSHGRSLRPSPTGGDSHSGSSYSEQGRTTLPPLTVAFPTFDSPVPANYTNPYHTQQRPSPVPYPQSYYPSTQQQPQAAYPGYPPYQPSSEQRYHGSQAYGSYSNRASSPSSSSTDPRRLPPPPLEVPREERWQGSQYYTTHTDLQTPHTSSDMRSPQSAYPHAPSYPQYQSLGSTTYAHSSSRGAAPSVATANPSYHQPMSMTHHALERSMPTSRNSAQLPYARPPMSPMDYEPQPESAESTIKKKRRRADARQLEALNATYARTAFPSTEERAQLAKDLDMSARSVQIWFQNKRQAARQGGRTAANPPPNPVPPPAPTPTPPVSTYRGSPVVVSPMVETSGPTYSSRSPPPTVRSGQTPSPPSGRFLDHRHWSGPSRGY